MTTKDISEILCIHKSTVYQILDRNNIEKRGKRKYFHYDDYFNIIDSKEKAYLLGWIYSDGHNNVSKSTLELEISNKDSYILDFFGKSISKDGNYKIYKKYGKYSSIRICNKGISASLENMGCGNRKSLNLTFPTNIEEPLLSHFMRGYFDGDGSISVRKLHHLYIQICGTFEFLNSFKNFFKNINGFSIKPINNIFQLRIYNQPEIKTFFEFLYKDCGNFFLTRKREIFEKAFELQVENIH